MKSHPADALPIGYTIAGWRVIRLLGAGGFAYTYLCEPVSSQQRQDKCVLKELFPMGIAQRKSDYSIVLDEVQDAIEIWDASVDNFMDEARALSALRSHNIPSYMDTFSANNSYYLLQEYIEGQSLKEFRNTLCQQDDYIESTMQLLKELLITLDHIHQQGLLHRDIKPANIMMRAADNSSVLIDFGGVRFQVGGVTHNFNKRVWSPGYSSPEQISTDSVEQKPASDLYALAATFFFILFGEDPLDSRDRLLGIEELSLQTFKGLWPSAFLDSVEPAFSLSTKQRFQTAQEWLLAFDHNVKMESKPFKVWRVGRDPKQVDIVLTDCSDEVSRFHLEIQLVEGGYHLIDYSTNGVVVIRTDSVGQSNHHKIEGQYFLDQEYGNVELDLAGNRYWLSQLINNN